MPWKSPPREVSTERHEMADEVGIGRGTLFTNDDQSAWRVTGFRTGSR